MLIGVIADDFTGASDIANTLAKGVAPEGGLRTAQYPGIPKNKAAADIDAGVISLKSRSAPVEVAVADSLKALAWLRDQGCRQIIFKYCSTFDSTRQGNIGPVASALACKLNARNVVICPAFPAAGRSVYQGHLFVHDRLLNESGMENHPLTPMTDADIRRVLAGQIEGAVGHLPYPQVAQGTPEIARAFSEQAGAADFIVVDALQDRDLLAIGAALADAALVTGGSGIAMGLPRNFIASGQANGRKVEDRAVSGPGAILAGSCSGATLGQIEHHKANHPAFPIEVEAVMSGRVTAATLVDFVTSQCDPAPLVYSSGSPQAVKGFQEKFGREAVSDTLDTLFADTAQALLEAGYRRLVVAGGETSGAVAQTLAVTLGHPPMMIGAEIDPGIPVLTLGKADPVALALKSGNFGSADFFEKALRIMECGA
ncbi:3-oxo-tetronate kinase [Roseibium sp. HPY-6]|uniref:3-oxo-tetronate kinase n=1 Tax=Roseibium sp. HPY-6 TaxID=3229852 RepID=UPI00338D7FC3